MSNRYALLIGASEFINSNQLSYLRAPRNDVQGLNDVLSSPNIGGFQTTNYPDLCFIDAMRVTEKFFSNRSFDDMLLFYYSGHGLRDNYGRLFLALRDTDLGYLRSSSLSSSVINEMMSDSRASQQIIILDCCYSGAFARNFLNKGNREIKISEHFNSRGRVILTASNSIQLAWDSNNASNLPEYSCFTKFLVDGLKTGSADLNQDGYITVNELYEYARPLVITENAQQSPQIWTFDKEGDIRIANNRLKNNTKLFLGSYNADINSDGVLLLPNTYPILSELILTKGIDNCILAYRVELYDLLVSQLLEMQDRFSENPQTKKLNFLVYGTAFFVKVEGRKISLCDELRAMTKTEASEVVFVGNGEYFEIWPVDEWKKYFMDLEKYDDELTNNINFKQL